jgi:membrane-bound lytic murein transglycosylase D
VQTITTKRLFLIAIAGLLWCTVGAAEPAGSFARPPALEPDILFWTKVYTEVDTRGGMIHDSSHLGVVYEVVRFPKGAGPRTQRRLVKSAKKRYKNILLALARGKRENLSDDQARVLALWPEGVSNKSLRAATRRLRFQLGQSDKFQAGLARSGIWESHIRNILADMGLPKELVALPHVESSFNPKARSRVGAAGLWQFTRSTGRRFMRIDRSVDERMDPYLATVAAARLLSHNYTATGTWPLAITSYNHGTAGMRRAARKLGTKDITRIVREYRSRRFGFASRNFYVAFLAAVEIHFNPDRYFNVIPRHSVPPTQLVRVPDYVSIGTLQRVLGIDKDVLRELNPALRSSIWRGAKYVPRGYELRIPASEARDEVLAALSQISEDERYGSQTRDRYYKVRRGNTLAGIAKHFEIDLDDLVAVNGLPNRHRIRTGQVLALPLPDGVKVDPAAPVPSAGPPPAQPEPTLVAENGQYTVRRGDSVWLIARRLGVAEETLVSLNELGDGGRIHVGQVLRVEAEKPPPVVIAAASTDAEPLEVAGQAVPDTTLNARIEAPGAEPAEGADAGAAMAGEDTAPLSATQPLVVAAGEPAVATEMPQAIGDTTSGVAAVAGDTPPDAVAEVVEDMTPEHVSDGSIARVEQAEPISDEVVEDMVPEHVSDGSIARVEQAEPVSDEVLEDMTPEHVSDGLIARVEQAEPVSAEEAEEIAPALPLTVQPDLSADPSDYSVVANDSIEVQAAETLGHYAEWLELRAWRLRQLNGMRYRQPVVIGQRLSLDFSRVSASDFEHRRIAYHRSLQESFFKSNRIAGTSTHVIRPGESLWILARRTYEIPVWLLRQYNPDLDFAAVAIGVTVTVPRVESLGEEPTVARATTAKAD